MTLRADHVAGAAFIGFGFLILVLSGDLPFGRLSMPGAGFMPNLIAWLLIGLGALLALRAAQESPPLADIAWNDLKHALLVIVITGAAVYFYEDVGFIITMFVMMFALLLLVERRNPIPAALYSLLVVFLAFNLFDNALKAKLPGGPLDAFLRVPLRQFL
jgi:Tripartite tricarboxylate transporter TctB family